MKKSKNVRHSESLHSKGAQLITFSRLLQILEKYGEVRPLGSYHANLMMRGDIDFHVVNPNGYTMREVLSVFNEIAITGHFEKQMIWNWDKKSRSTDWKPVEDLSGYYICLTTRYGGVKWKIDIWFLDAVEQAKEDRKELNVMNMSITDEQRETILAFKKLRDKFGIEFCSQKIYELVLVKGMSSQIMFMLLLIRERFKR